jgi:hypothetical protein
MRSIDLRLTQKCNLMNLVIREGIIINIEISDIWQAMRNIGDTVDHNLSPRSSSMDFRRNLFDRIESSENIATMRNGHKPGILRKQRPQRRQRKSESRRIDIPNLELDFCPLRQSNPRPNICYRQFPLGRGGTLMIGISHDNLVVG